jgi:hypothetical protein
LGINRTLEEKERMIQKNLITGISILIEFYRVFIGCAYAIFAPVDCGDHPCNFIENLLGGSTLDNANYVFNVITILVFAGHYYIELKRENKLNRYMKINHEIPSDTQSIGNVLTKLTDKRQFALRKIHRYYKLSTYFTLFMFSLNTLFSGVVIFVYYLDPKSGTAFFTNTLFIGTKLYQSLQSVNAENNIYYSAYSQSKIQFNDVNPEKMKDTSKGSDMV